MTTHGSGDISTYYLSWLSIIYQLAHGHGLGVTDDSVPLWVKNYDDFL